MIRAALFDGPGQPFRHVELAKPKLADGEVLVKVSLATVCGSDLHTLAGKRTEPTPCVLGHEAVGVVEEVCGVVKAIDGETIQVGDRVVWTVAASCGKCFFCTHDLTQKCETLKKYGHVRQAMDRGPAGSFASHVHLWSGTRLVKIPASLPDSVASPAACATATVAGAFHSIEGAETILVLGCGLLGLTACAMGRASGMKIFVVDALVERVAMAKAFGAAEAYSLPNQLEELKAIIEKLPGRGIDAVLEFSGSTDLTTTAIPFLRTGGSLILIGAVFPTPPLNLLPEMLIRKCLTIRGLHNYGPSDLLRAVQFLTEHHAESPFVEVVAKQFPLADLAAAAEYAECHRPLRVGVTCGALP